MLTFAAVCSPGGIQQTHLTITQQRRCQFAEITIIINNNVFRPSVSKKLCRVILAAAVLRCLRAIVQLKVLLVNVDEDFTVSLRQGGCREFSPCCLI